MKTTVFLSGHLGCFAHIYFLFSLQLTCVACLLGRLFLIHQTKIQITIHYLKSGQEVLPGVRASALVGKTAVPIMRPSWEGLSAIPLGFFYPLCCKSVDTFDSLTDF